MFIQILWLMSLCFVFCLFVWRSLFNSSLQLWLSAGLIPRSGGLTCLTGPACFSSQAKSQFKRRSTANNVEIHIPVPTDADSPKFKTTVGSVKWVPENSEIVWSIKSFPVSTNHHSSSSYRCLKYDLGGSLLSCDFCFLLLICLNA